MQFASIHLKPKKTLLSVFAMICYGLFIIGVYEFSEHQAGILEWSHFQSKYVYIFAGALLLGYCAYLFVVHHFKLHPVLIPISAILTLFFGNSIFLYVVSEVVIIGFSVIVFLITLLQFSRAKDASLAAMLICLLNISIFIELSTIVNLGVHIMMGSVAVLYALNKQWTITHHIFMFVLCGSGLFYFLVTLVDGTRFEVVLCVLFAALYVWTYRKMKAKR